MPDVSKMTDAGQLDTLSRNYERAEKRARLAGSDQFAFSIGQVHGYMKYLRFPKGLYRDAIWDLAEHTEDKEVQLKSIYSAA